MMRIGRCLAGVRTLSTVTITALTARHANGSAQPVPLPFTGIPRDIDWQKFGTQLVLHAGPTDELISVTSNHGIVRIALLGLMLRKEITVEYVDEQSGRVQIISASLPLEAKEAGQVAEISFAEKDNYCRAAVIHEDVQVNVWTRSALMQGVIETAAREAIPIQNLEFDTQTFELKRGKVNIELPQDT